MKFDLHTHHDRCGHAVGRIEDYIQAAMEQELDVIGISDHSPFFAEEKDHPEPKIAMPRSEFETYVQEVLSLKEKYKGKIKVLLGVESDFFPEHVPVYKQWLSKYPFDYIIGSVHRSGGISIFNRNRWKRLNDAQKLEVKEDYYDLIERSARSGLFQVLGHIDAMKANYPPFSDIKTDRVEQTLKAIAESGTSIEVNTSGKTKEVGGWYPSDEILEMALHYRVDITFGSDAHLPERVGDEWTQVKQRLKEIGFSEWVYYERKERIAVPLTANHI